MHECTCENSRANRMSCQVHGVPDAKMRMYRAMDVLKEKIASSTSAMETTRLQGKIEGVSLALSYLNEIDR